MVIDIYKLTESQGVSKIHMSKKSWITYERDYLGNPLVSTYERQDDGTVSSKIVRQDDWKLAVAIAFFTP